MLILIFWAMSPFQQNEFFKDLAALSKNLAVLFIWGRWKCYQSISRPKKPVEPNFRSFWFLVQDLRSFKGFFEKIQQSISFSLVVRVIAKFESYSKSRRSINQKLWEEIVFSWRSNWEKAKWRYWPTVEFFPKKPLNDRKSWTRMT